MTSAQALAEAKRLAAGGQARFSSHARDRMNERGATARDVLKAIASSTAATFQTDRDNWKLTGGLDLDGERLSVVVDFVADLIIVTIF